MVFDQVVWMVFEYLSEQRAFLGTLRKSKSKACVYRVAGFWLPHVKKTRNLNETICLAINPNIFFAERLPRLQDLLFFCFYFFFVGLNVYTL